MNTQPENEQAQSWYITTSIPYVNAQPHIGFALEAIQADVLARYHRLRGDSVRFQTGTDENSLKNVQAAERAGVPTAVLVEQNSNRFRGLEGTLGLSTDDFIRTSAEARHVAGVYKLWRACAVRGDIYTRAYRGLYCVGCEQFYEESELADGRCPIHGTRPDVVEEENYFFRLSRYGDELQRLIESDQLQIVPETRKSEVLSFIRRGLHDFSISRSQTRAKGWGIPVPDDASQVIYVWFDALTNYISALGYAEEAADYRALLGTQPPAHACDRQRYYPVSCHLLAGHADLGGCAVADDNFCPRFHYGGRPKDQQIDRQCDRSSAIGAAVWQGRVTLLSITQNHGYRGR